MSIAEATDAAKVLKEKIKEFNMKPDYVTIVSVEKQDNKWIIVFWYLFEQYTAEIDENGRIMSLKRIERWL